MPRNQHVALRNAFKEDLMDEIIRKHAYDDRSMQVPPSPLHDTSDFLSILQAYRVSRNTCMHTIVPHRFLCTRHPSSQLKITTVCSRLTSLLSNLERQTARA